MSFRFPKVDTLSFILGFISAIVLWIFVSLIRPFLKQAEEKSQAKKTEAKEKAHSISGVEEHYRQQLLQAAQGMHLAAPLFSLDEIVEPPRLLAPPPRVEPGAPIPNEDIVESTIPYLPAWPEFGAFYQVPTLTLSEALSGNSDIVLVGQTGAGKTVALACLASRLARLEPEPGLPTNTLPFLVHVADLVLPVSKEDPLKPLVDLIGEKASMLDLGRIPDLVRRAFVDGRALLLIDGTDELTPDGLKGVVEFIKIIKRTFPKTRVVTTASTEYLDGLVSLNFIPFALASWTVKQKTRFIERWGELWMRYVAREAWAQTSERVDPLILNGWLGSDITNLNPLELTLKAWAAYAGDIRGPRPIDFLETHLRRLTPANAPREALESLALQVSLATEPIFDPRQARGWIKSFEPPEPAAPSEPSEDAQGKKPGKQDRPQAPSMGLITKMAESGLLTQHRNNRMRFSHPIFGGYLAGKALSHYNATDIINQPPWIGKFLAMHYLAAQGDVTPLVDILLSQLDRPLSRNLLVPARWLRDAPRQAPWRGKLFAKMAELLQQTGQPLGLRGQALAAFIQSNDNSVALLFRQLLDSTDSEMVQLAVIGCGALQDEKAIGLLSTLLNSPSPNIRRAACLALVMIGTNAAMDSLASGLLHGDDNLRRSVAEAMAFHPREGHAMLREGAALKEDLMVRRAVVYGLGRIREPWADELLATLQLDEQWVVRNAAVEVGEEAKRPNNHIPKRLQPPSESPWLIAFAGKQGMGVAPDKPPTELLLLALKSGTEEEQMAALYYLRMMPVEGVFGALYHAMYGGHPELRETVFQTFSEMAARGVDVPDPIQFGVGY